MIWGGTEEKSTNVCLCVCVYVCVFGGREGGEKGKGLASAIEYFYMTEA